MSAQARSRSSRTTRSTRRSARVSLPATDVSSGRDRRRAYWDDGYMGNPAIFPLIYGCDSRDVVIIHINPLERANLPTTASDIMNRINEISFNSSLMREMREMRAIAFVTKLIDDGKILDNSMMRMLVHAIEAADVMADLRALHN